MDLTPIAAEYSFAPHWLELPGARLHYVDEGQGPVLLFVHGNPTWSFAWRKFITTFSQGANTPAPPPATSSAIAASLAGEGEPRIALQRFRCIAVDHIGCGRSDKPADYHYTLDQHIANLLTLIDRLDLRDITLVGHDWGGCIGMGAAVERPDRFARFVLMNTAAFRSTRIPLRIAVCRIPLLGAIGVQGFNLFSRAALTMAVSKPKRMTAAVRAGYLAPYDSWAHRVAVHRFVQDIPLRPSHPSYSRLVRVEEGLAQFRDRPMLLPWGEQDWCFTPDFRREFERRFPQAESFPLADAGHYLFEDAHERVIPRMRQFLAKNP
jgi:haloalkane dehalogenase